MLSGEAAYAAPSNTRSGHDPKPFLIATAASVAKAMVQHSPVMAACYASIWTLAMVRIVLHPTNPLNPYSDSSARRAEHLYSGQRAKVSIPLGFP